MDLFRPEWKPRAMFKHVALLVRQEGMSYGEFVDYWQTNSPWVIPSCRTSKATCLYIGRGFHSPRNKSTGDRRRAGTATPSPGGAGSYRRT